MDKVNTLGAGIALAVTLALISAVRHCLCARPDATLDLSMHGVDLKTVKAATHQLWKSSLWHYRSIGRGLLAGFVFAWTYNFINRQ
jgi:hypothetical protein